MPLRWFNCPDGVRREIVECLEGCPRPEGRCLSLPTLKEVGSDREWRGKPSTTQLLNPTRLEYLKIKHDYAIDPHDRAFALLGTRHHRKLELVANKIAELHAEEKLADDVNTGIADLLEPDIEPDTWRLIDYKTWGAYAVAKVTGVKSNGEYEVNQVTLQLNDYRLKAQSIGFNVVKLFVQCTVRDGGTFSARNTGIDYKMKLIPVDILDDDIVTDYFAEKAKALIDAVNTDTMPPLCEFEARWGGRRCKGFCDAMHVCPEGAAVNKVELES